jgi:uncharacterized protein (DUF3820 family)
LLLPMIYLATFHKTGRFPSIRVAVFMQAALQPHS